MPNTDMKINYYLRQQKSIERRMFCHLFSNINKVFNVNAYRYIGMGAKYFTDFLLFHREFGFEKMISIEADEENQEKYEFNKPLKCIEMVYGYSTEVLPSLDWTSSQRSIVWLDYDGYLEKFMLEDIETIISKLNSGSMFFISFNSNWVKIANPKKQSEKRKELFEQNLETYCPISLSLSDFSEGKKHTTQCLPINNTINHAISVRSDIQYTQLIDFIYQDGAEMTTIGGIVLNDEDKARFDSVNFANLEFINKIQGSNAFSLKIPPLTYKEAIQIFEHLPCSDYTDIQIPGLDKTHIAQIAKIYRYYPFYLETSLFT